MIDANEILKRKGQLEINKQPFNSLWQEIGDFMYPTKANFNKSFGIGEKLRSKLWSSVGPHSLDLAASSILGIVANPTTHWINFTSDDEEINELHEAREYFDHAEQQVMNELNKPNSNFYGNMLGFIKSLLCFGTGAMYVKENKDFTHKNNLLEFTTIDINSLCIAEDASGYVDTKYLTTNYTVKQLKGLEDSLELDLHINLERMKLDDTIEVVIAIYPNRDYKEDLIGDKPFKHVWVDAKHKHVMLEDGFMEDPLAVARWEKRVGEVWGRGRGEVALADVKLLNMAEKAYMLAIEKQLNPPMQVPSDGTYGNIDISPGAINAIMTKDGRGLQVIESSQSLPAVDQYIKEKDHQVRQMFFVDQLQLISKANQTATEYMGRVDERNRLIAPNIGLINAEGLGKIIERCFGILSRNGKIRPAPDFMNNKDLKVNFISSISRSQRESDIIAMDNFINTAINLSQYDSTAMDNISLDGYLAERAEIASVPTNVLTSDKDKQIIRKSRQQQQQQQQQMAVAQQMLDGAKTAKEAGILDNGQQ